MSHVTTRHAKQAHKAWRNRPLREKWDYLLGKGYTMDSGTLCRAFRADEYAEHGWQDSTHQVRWEFDHALNRRRAVDDCGRTRTDWQRIADY